MLKNAPPLVISLIVHMGVLVGLAAFRYNLMEQEPDLVIETVIDDERVQQEFSQELEVDTTTSENLAVTAGGTPSANIGAASTTAINQTRIETSEIVRDPEIRIASVGNITIPGADELGMDLGEAQVVGETGARVPGYGAAMHRLTLELTRMMRQQPVLAVWLFDASGSLTDDRDEIRDNFQKILRGTRHRQRTGDIGRPALQRARNRRRSIWRYHDGTHQRSHLRSRGHSQRHRPSGG